MKALILTLSLLCCTAAGCCRAGQWLEERKERQAAEIRAKEEQVKRERQQLQEEKEKLQTELLAQQAKLDQLQRQLEQQLDGAQSEEERRRLMNELAKLRDASAGSTSTAAEAPAPAR